MLLGGNIYQTVTIHNSLSTTACSAVEIFAIGTRVLTSLTLCPSRRSAETFTRLSLCGAILKYTTITKFFLRCHSHRAPGGLNESWLITAKQLEF